MEVKGDYLFNAPAGKVWKLLLDPEVLARCMPGCEKLAPLGEGLYEATLSMGVGSIKGAYQVKISLADLVPERSYRLGIEGNGSPGFVRGEALITLEEQDGKTLVRIDGEAQVGGTIARVGQRLITSVNKKMMDRFFACIQESAGERDAETLPGE